MKGLGTHYYAGEWAKLDQFLISKAFYDTTGLIFKQAEILEFPFLFRTNKNGHQRPFRTFQGPRYIGGFSDHLPILLTLQTAKED
jgi:hypothetical protein